MGKTKSSRLRLNNDEEKRDKIIFGEYDPDSYIGGVRHFEGLTCDKLSDLLSQNFINPLEKKKNAPDVVQIHQFIERYPDYTAHGFAISNRRYDYRVTLEGIKKEKPPDSAAELEDFKAFSKDAVVVETGDKMYCWFE